MHKKNKFKAKIIYFSSVVLLLSIPFGLLANAKTEAKLHTNSPAKSNLQKSDSSSDIPLRREFPLSTKISPCENFHDYVCSEVESSFKLREDRSSHTFSFNDSFERLLTSKKSFFKNINKENSLTDRGQALKNYYLACMNTAEGAKEEKKWLQKYSQDIQKITTIDSYLNYMSDNLKKGAPSVIEFAPSENSDNPNIYDAYIEVGFMNLPDHSYYDNKDLMSDYRQLIISFFKNLNDKKMTTKELEARADAILQFEKEFIKIYPKPEVRRQRWIEKRQLPQSQFLTQFPNIKAENFITEFPKEILMRVNIPEALKFYNDALIPANLNTLKDFFLYAAFSGYMDDAYPQFYKQKFEFNQKYLGGPNQRPERDERCTMKIMHTFTKELDEILLPRIFPNFPEEKFRTVANKIREAIVKGVEQNTWLSKDAKKEARAKMANARLQLIKPNNDREWDFNPLLKYSTTARIHNDQILSEALYKKSIKELGEPTNLDRWGMGPLTINAYYDPSANKFVLPIGILQFPFFDADGGLIENLGSVGAVIGHELGHGIDDQGSKFDQFGKLNQWMSMDDLATFSAKTNKLIDQYNKIGHNGKLTLGENVADLVGVTFGYSAAFPNNEGSIEDKKKFFISYARLWCAVVRPQYAELQLKSNPHSLGWARINEPIKHIPGFYEAFQCKEGDKMFLPESSRVKIW